MISLDIIRIFACFSVVMVHASIMFNIPGRLGRFMEAGSNGLGIFYILSGFLIFMTLDKEHVDLKKWYIKRLIRILPIYYTVVIFYIIFYEGIVRMVPEDTMGLKWISYFLCINTIVGNDVVFWYNLGALSSMSVFVWFYLLAPMMKKIITNWNQSALFFVFSYVLLRLLQYTQWFRMFRAYYYIAIGIWVYYSIKEHKEKLTSILFLCVMLLIQLAGGEGGLLYALTIAVIMMNSYNVSVDNDRAGAIIRFLSDRTFAIYLAHTVAIQIIDQISIENVAIKVIMFYGITIIGIIILHEIVERYTVRLYNRLKRA